MTRPDPAPEEFYQNDGDKTLVEKIHFARSIEWSLLAMDVFGLLFWQSDVRDFQRIAMPSWWAIPILILHLVATGCICAYLTNALHYLCLYRANPTLQTTPGAIRQRQYRDLCHVTELCGSFTSIALIIVALVPHLLMERRPDYHFFGFMIAKMALITIVIQLTLLFTTWLEIRSGIKEWRSLRQQYPAFRFYDYARFYNGYEDSIYIGSKSNLKRS